MGVDCRDEGSPIVVFERNSHISEQPVMDMNHIKATDLGPEGVCRCQHGQQDGEDMFHVRLPLI